MTHRYRTGLTLLLIGMLLCSSATHTFAALPLDPYGDTANGYGTLAVVVNPAQVTGAPDRTLATVLGVGGGLEIDMGAQEPGTGALRVTYGGIGVAALVTVEFRDAANNLITTGAAQLVAVNLTTRTVTVPYTGTTPYRYVRFVGLATLFGIDAVEDLGFATADYDGDGLPNGWEMTNGLDPLSGTGAQGASGDPDADGLTNAQEFAHGTKPTVADTDGDGLTDGAEVNIHHSNPLLADSDADGMPDGWEVTYAFNPNDPSDAPLDADGDTFTNLQEYRAGTNPRVADGDSDGDGLPNSWETDHGLNPNDASDAAKDLDNDDLTNIQEFTRGTDPQKADTDGDGLSDGAEVNTHHTNPLLADTDADGMPDGWEVTYTFNPNDASDAAQDADSDTATNLQEYRAGTNPRVADTDADGMPDGWEMTHDFNPNDASDAARDADSDQLTNLQEYRAGTNPRLADTDADGMPDGWEMTYAFNPNDPSDAPLDADGDGATNLQEFERGTNPRVVDIIVTTPTIPTQGVTHNLFLPFVGR